MKKCTPLGREAHVEVKMYKKPQLRSPSKSCDVEKVHAVVARSTFASEKAKNTSRSEHFWKLRCRKSARRCGVKHISKSKCTKYLSLGSLLKVEMFKKCTPLWREAHVGSQNAQNTTCSRHFWTLKRRFVWRVQGIPHPANSEQNVRVLWHFQKRWRAGDMRRGSAKMDFAWQAQYKRHVHQRC